MTTDGIVVTCMDPRIDPLAILGLDLPRAAILRTPGGRVTDDTVEGVAMARALFDIEWIIVMHHRDCGLHRPRSTIESLASDAIGHSTSLPGLRLIENPAEALEEDVALLANPHGVAAGLATAGFTWDPKTSTLIPGERHGPPHPIFTEPARHR